MSDSENSNLSEKFGANDWLVDELFEKYQIDKNLVDEEWRTFFETYQSNPLPTAGSRHAIKSDNTKNVLPKQSPPKNIAEPVAEQKVNTQQSENSPIPAAEQKVNSQQSENSPIPAAEQKVNSQQSENSPIPADVPNPEPIIFKDTKTTSHILKGAAKAIASNMESSLEIPTATSVRAIPAKVLIDNRIVINDHLRRTRGGKVSFTHIIGFAIIRALKQFPSQNVHYETVEGKPAAIHPEHVNFGLAIDIPKPDGTRSLVVPNIKAAEEMDFTEFWLAYENLVKRARKNELTTADYSGTTVSLTNPGGIGTVHSIPRLSKGQACIIGVGALEYPAQFQGTAEETLAKLAVSKIITLTSTYDHRVIQGAGSGEFLRIVQKLLLGEQNFYDEIFETLRIPYEPVRWSVDIQIDPADEVSKTSRIQDMIQSYRELGHIIADVDPLEYKQRKHPDLDIKTHGLTLWDLDREWPTGDFDKKNMLKLRDFLSILRDSYCRTIGLEYMHIQNPEERRWMQERIEQEYKKPDRSEQLKILAKLNVAEAFETFLQTKFVGQKRFSLEGGESLIPLLDAIISEAADEGLEEVAIGMAHRGRLNVLTNIAGKTYAQVFREFEGTQDPRSVQGSGDVKYHLGTEGVFISDKGNKTKIYICANPSHLEAADPVLEGIVRAKQDMLDHGSSDFPVLPILIHGDAAFAGQGVVAETLNLSQLRGYRTGGTVHIVINNQVGFTTAPSSSRSTVYCTDIAKMIQAPIFHVNGDDPEAVVRVAALAFDYRQSFNKDVVIDMICYRRRGHNEGDDPSMTQPLMYNLIEKKRSVRTLYTQALIGRGDITEVEAEQALKDYQAKLERAFAETKAAQTSQLPIITNDIAPVADIERPLSQQSDQESFVVESTAVSANVLKQIGLAHKNVPNGFKVHPKLLPLLEKRYQMSVNGEVDWGYAELLAFGCLLLEGVPIRLTGQDSRRGTFVQRHAVLHDRNNGLEWTPLANLNENQAKFWVYDSLLSEYAALGFEYGYSVERSDALVLWEAQFGDFANGAQTIIDEFISSAEQKWGQHSSLVLLLPHGYEGQGPDHSSARIERYLQLCAEKNMIISAPSTPASYFHLLRKQAYSRPRKPLVVFTPKSMLRLKSAASSLASFTQGTFQPVIGETEAIEATQVNKVLLVSGKLYYDLAATRQKNSDYSVAIIRLEQLYPLPIAQLEIELAKYPQAEIRWVQEEPENQGAWPFMGLYLSASLNRKLNLVARPGSAATSTGSAKVHAKEQAKLLIQAFE